MDNREEYHFGGLEVLYFIENVYDIAAYSGTPPSTMCTTMCPT